MVVGAHIDQALEEEICQGNYIDFAKLLPRDRILSDDESKLELVIKNGKTFWSPMSDTVTISNFQRWEQAFRVYANIYTKFCPNKAGELIEYNHVIHSISLTFTWENIYAYDRESRMHIARHPERSWVVILQQAWAIRLCLDPSLYSCQGVRLGYALDLLDMGLSVETIKKMGRWRSNAIYEYFKV